jgi:hypothetical protein
MTPCYLDTVTEGMRSRVFRPLKQITSINYL